MAKNYIFEYTIGTQDLNETKNPPLCDGCNNSFEADEHAVHHVKALVLNNYIWGLICTKCSNRFKKVRQVSETESPLNARRALHSVLGKPMLVEAR